MYGLLIIIYGIDFNLIFIGALIDKKRLKGCGVTSPHDVLLICSAMDAGLVEK